MGNNRKAKGSIILRIAIFAVSIYMIVTLCGLWGELIDSQNRYKQLEAQRDSLNADIDNLVTVLEGSQSEIIEKAARQRLGYVYAGEQVYIDNSGN
ncbi:MAG: septum formation initiator family protein [Clostridia bacterium]|nr:septum formation initiator family protein [Clostridia bacterium]